jgi:hypothetical protein
LTGDGPDVTAENAIAWDRQEILRSMYTEILGNPDIADDDDLTLHGANSIRG